MHLSKLLQSSRAISTLEPPGLSKTRYALLTEYMNENANDLQICRFADLHLSSPIEV